MSNSLRIAYAGTPEFAVPALTAIEHSHHELITVITQPDRRSGRGRKILKSAVKQAITSGSVQILQPKNVNDEDILSTLEDFQLDVIVVAAYGQIFSKALLELPKLGCINIHASLLPRWRGASPIQHAILAGDEVTGVTIMQMAAAMDAGDIWLQSICVIDPQDTAQSLHNKLAQIGGELILPALDKINKPHARPMSQNEQDVTYCKKLTKSDGLIDWRLPADDIVRRIRAYHPWPTAYTYLEGRRIRITLAEVGDQYPTNIEAGKICHISKAGFSVAAGQAGTVAVKLLVPEGGKQVSAFDFSNSNQLIDKQFDTLCP